MVFFSLFVLSWLYFFVRDMIRGNMNIAAWFFGAIVPLGIATIWLVWRLRVTAPKAELLNLRFLENAGQPYPRDASARPVQPTVTSRVLGAVLMFLLYDLTYGALTLALKDRALSLGHVVGRGAIWAAFMVIANLTFLRARHERQSRRPTAGSSAG